MRMPRKHEPKAKVSSRASKPRKSLGDWRADTLAEVRRVLRPGGWIWFSEPNMLNPQIALEKNVGLVGRWLQNSPDETAFVRYSLTRRLRRAGFADVTVRPYDFLHPGLPGALLRPVRAVNVVLERTPLLREIAGSLEIVARQP